jgi:hypothetical protein
MKEIKYTTLYCVCENFSDSILLQFRIQFRFRNRNLRFRFLLFSTLRFRFHKPKRWFRFRFQFHNAGRYGTNTVSTQHRTATEANFYELIRNCKSKYGKQEKIVTIVHKRGHEIKKYRKKIQKKRDFIFNTHMR